MMQEEILAKAHELFGDDDKAWMQQPARGLDYRIPVDVMLTEAGRQRVYELLGRIEYGVYI